MTYRWKDGLRIKVVTDGLGAPRRFKLRGTWHEVEQVVERWRVDQQWWDRQVWHAVFRLITRKGLLVTIYRDLVSNEWYIQHIYD